MYSGFEKLFSIFLLFKFDFMFYLKYFIFNIIKLNFLRRNLRFFSSGYLIIVIFKFVFQDNWFGLRELGIGYFKSIFDEIFAGF